MARQAFLVIFCATAAVIVAGQGTCAGTYTVQSGDSLSSIAASHSVTLAAIEQANPQISSPFTLYPGEVVNIPPCSAVSPSPSPSPSPGPSAPASSSIRAAYWGQGAASETLADVCTRYSIVDLSFLPNFGNGQDVTADSSVNIAGHSLSQTATDIQTCQGQGVKIILSIGGGVGNYSFTSTSDAQSTADQIWNAYLGGSGTNRPFGTAVLDGVDLDIEKDTGKQYYSAFAQQLAGYFSGASKQYLLTAVPQCPYPDNNLGPGSGTALGDSGSLFDYVSIQFYNNPGCDGTNTVSGYQPWSSWASSVGRVKLLPTFPASSSDAGGGYQSASDVGSELSQISSSPTYGGFNVFTAEDDDGFSSAVAASA